MMARGVLVLGYHRDDGRPGIAPLALAGVRRAEALAGEGDVAVVVCSGFARGDGPAEGSLMRHAWAGPPVELLAETEARDTVENATLSLPLLVIVLRSAGVPAEGRTACPRGNAPACAGRGVGMPGRPGAAGNISACGESRSRRTGWFGCNGLGCAGTAAVSGRGGSKAGARRGGGGAPVSAGAVWSAVPVEDAGVAVADEPALVTGAPLVCGGGDDDGAVPGDGAEPDDDPGADEAGGVDDACGSGGLSGAARTMAWRGGLPAERSIWTCCPCAAGCGVRSRAVTSPWSVRMTTLPSWLSWTICPVTWAGRGRFCSEPVTPSTVARTSPRGKGEGGVTGGTGGRGAPGLVMNNYSIF